MSSKNNRQLRYISFALKTANNKYNLGTLDRTNLVYFYRNDKETYTELSTSQYRLINENNMDKVEILDQLVIDKYIAFEIMEEVKFDSSEYNPTGNPDVGELIAEYNEVVRDLKELWHIVKTQVMMADDGVAETTLPVLRDKETWYWDDQKKQFRGLKVLDLEAEANKLRTKLEEYVETVAKPEVKKYGIDEIDAHLGGYALPTITSKVAQELTSQGTAYIETVVKPDINNYTGQKKTEINTVALQEKKTIADEGGKQLSAIQNLMDNILLDMGTIQPGVMLENLTEGYWYTDDIRPHTGLAIDTALVSGVYAGQVSITIKGAKKVFVFRNTIGKEVFTYYIATQYLEWEDLGSNDLNFKIVAHNDLIEFPTNCFVPAHLGSNGKWEYAKSQTPADGLAKRISSTEVKIYFGGDAVIHPGAVDDEGNPYKVDEYYFLPTIEHLGFGASITNPTSGVWQALFYAVNLNGILHAEINIEAPQNIDPVVVKDGDLNSVVSKSELDQNYLNKTESDIRYALKGNAGGSIFVGTFIDEATLLAKYPTPGDSMYAYVGSVGNEKVYHVESGIWVAGGDAPTDFLELCTDEEMVEGIVADKAVSPKSVKSASWMTRAKKLTGPQNLNSLTIPGTYNAWEQNVTHSNSPTDVYNSAFSLEVLEVTQTGGKQFMTQRLVDASGKTWRRIAMIGIWSEWRHVAEDDYGVMNNKGIILSMDEIKETGIYYGTDVTGAPIQREVMVMVSRNNSGDLGCFLMGDNMILHLGAKRHGTVDWQWSKTIDEKHIGVLATKEYVSHSIVNTYVGTSLPPDTLGKDNDRFRLHESSSTTQVTLFDGDSLQNFNLRYFDLSWDSSAPHNVESIAVYPDPKRREIEIYYGGKAAIKHDTVSIQIAGGTVVDLTIKSSSDTILSCTYPASLDSSIASITKTTNVRISARSMGAEKYYDYIKSNGKWVYFQVYGRREVIADWSNHPTQLEMLAGYKLTTVQNWHEHKEFYMTDTGRVKKLLVKYFPNHDGTSVDEATRGEFWCEKLEKGV